MNGIYDEFHRIEREAMDKQFATKLLDGIERLYEDFEDARKRWVWELIQNAADASDGNLRIEIEYSDFELIFRHNAKPFDIKGLLFLIKQTSTKERKPPADANEQPATVGKYGTGFMTTYLMSKKVFLKSVFHDTIAGEYLPFQFLIDRSPEDIPGMIKEVNKAAQFFKDLENVEKHPPIPNYKPCQTCDTSFRYILECQNSRETVKLGLEYFESTIAYVLAFNPKIAEITLKNGQNSTVYKRMPMINITQDLLAHQINKDQTPIYIFTAQAPKVTIAFQISLDNGTPTIIQKDSKLPTIFTNFPLIGSQEFRFPIVINSLHFVPNEKRSTILLLQGAHKDTNRGILQNAFQLYTDVFPRLKQINRLHRLINFMPSIHPQLDDWYLPQLNKIRTMIMDQPIVINQAGKRIKMKDTKFIFYRDAKTTIKLCELFEKYFETEIPKLEESYINFWNKSLDSIWNSKLNIKVKGKEVFVDYLANFQNIQTMVYTVGSEAQSFNMLNQFYALALNDSDLPNLKIFPNQYGTFNQLYSSYYRQGLFVDDNIDETLKAVAYSIRTVDYRNILLHKSVKITYTKKTMDDIVSDINNNLQPSHLDAIYTLTSLRPPATQLNSIKHREKIFKIAQTLKLTNKTEQNLTNYHSEIWSKSDKLLGDYVVAELQKIAHITNLEKLTQNPFTLISSVIDCFSSQVGDKKVFPNLKGEFCPASSLKNSKIVLDLTEKFPRSKEHIAQILLKLVEYLGQDYEQTLLDPKINSKGFVKGEVSLEAINDFIDKHLSTKENYEKPEFRAMFPLLLKLDKTYKYNLLESYKRRKQDMYYAISSPEEKELAMELFESEDGKKKFAMVKDLSLSEIEKLLEFNKKMSAKETQQLLQMKEALADESIEIGSEGFETALEWIKTLTHLHHSANLIELDEIEDALSELIPQQHLELYKQMIRDEMPPFPKTYLEFKKTRAEMIDSATKPTKEQPKPIPNPLGLPKLSLQFWQNTYAESKKIINKQSEPELTQKQFDRAVRNTIIFLQNQGEYDCTLITLVRSPFSNVIGDVVYLGKLISVVIIPSDRGYFMITSEEEVEALKQMNCQLWVENGQDEPCQVTLGSLIINSKLAMTKLRVTQIDKV